jgi:hypothetical protein
MKHTIALVLITFLAMLCSCKEEPSVPLLFTAREGDSPCWQTLCAGQGTDKTLVASLLEEIPGVSNIKESIETNDVDFLWQDPENSNIRVAGTISIYLWHIQIIALRPEYKVNLGQFIRIFGEPSCVEVIDGVNTKSLSLVYPDLGIRTRLQHLESKDNGYLRNNLDIYDIRGFVPTSEFVCQDHYPAKAYKWEGFTKIYP